MFTGKIPKEMPEKMLRVIHAMYLDKHGHGIRHLEEFHVLATAHELFSQHLDGLWEVNGRVVRPLLLDNFKELERRGYLRNEGGLKYFLTERGYDHAAKGKWQRFVDYWNSNPGLNTLVSILSALIASISLVVAIVAVVKAGAPTAPSVNAVESSVPQEKTPPNIQPAPSPTKT